MVIPCFMTILTNSHKSWNILKKLSYEFKNCFKFFIFIMRVFLRIFHDLWLFVRIAIKHGITNAIVPRVV